MLRLLICAVSLPLVACESASASTCFYYVKNLGELADPIFVALGDKYWEDPDLQQYGFHRSGYHLLIEATCDLTGMKGLTEHLNITNVGTTDYEFREISAEEFQEYRRGIKPMN